MFTPVYAGNIPATSDPGPYFGSFRTLSGHFPIVRCERCRLVQTRPRDDAKTLGEAYASMPADDAAELREAAERMAEDQARAVFQRVARDGRVLDVGGGAGAFAAVLAKAGRSPSVLEPSKAALDLVRARVPGAVAIEGTIEGARIAPRSFEAITLWDVLEHLIDPRALVAKLRAWLAPRGHLFLQLPNIGSVVAKVLGGRWPLLLREHLTYFDGSTVRRLLEDAGFDVLSVRPSLRFFPLSHLGRRLGIPLESGRLLEKRVVGLPAGEMRVVARARG